jgi:hypothetical protein
MRAGKKQKELIVEKTKTTDGERSDAAHGCLVVLGQRRADAKMRQH